ncbi:MAG TPA: C-terminal binding protein [Gemmataceae bacterium]|nr:C-terminal binding protein [Gemmataceae bacterium]
MPKVVITDSTFPNIDPERHVLEPAGCEVVVGKTGSESELIELTRDADGIISQFANLTPAVIGRMQQVKIIVRNGIGYDNIDVEAARQQRIPVCNIPDYCINEVADQTLAFVLALTRQLLPNHDIIRAGRWGLAVRVDQMKALAEMTVGVVGFGRIGRAVVKRLLAFAGRVVVADPYVGADTIQATGAEPTSLDDLFANSDLITLHCLLNAQTRGLINVQTLARTKRGVLLINVGRGGLVVTEALIAALTSGHVAAAGLDVFEQEPLPADSPLRAMENVVVASHIASVSARAMKILRESSARLVLKAFRGEKLENVVNGVE